MAFLDDLTLVLDLLILVACTVFYTGFVVWLEMRRNDRPRARVQLRQGATLMGSLGAVLGLIALWGEFTWPIQLAAAPTLAAYNLFFFDPMMLLAILLVSFAIAVNRNLPTHFVGMLGVVCGFGVMYYGYRGYVLPLTLDPLTTFLLYLGFGGVAVLSYPVTLYLDWFVVGPSVVGVAPLPSDSTPRYHGMWTLFLGLFLLVVILAGIAALFYGFDTAWAHLASPP
jgi:putative membrane protein